jgi:phenylacetate-CoA ligase
MSSRELIFLDSLKASRWLKPQALHDYQTPLLERLCRHAATQTAFYAERLARLFEAGDPVGGAFLRHRWADIPIIGRAEVSADPTALHARAGPAAIGPGHPILTSGSTGRPVPFLVSDLALVAGFAVFGRMVVDHELDPTRALCWIRAQRDGDAPLPDGGIFPNWTIVADGLRYDLTRDATMEQAAAWLARRRPAYLMTYPSIILGVLDALEAAGERVELGAVITTGENAHEDFAERVRAGFGARHVDTFASREVGTVAVDCPVAPVKHLSAEIILTEIVRDDGEIATPGEMGRVVATPLYGYSMPLIRYQTGDYAVQGSAAPCVCGRGLPTLERVLGRTRNLLRLPDGSKRSPGGLGSLGEHLSMRRYQLVQTAVDHCELRYVADPEGRLADFDGARALLQERIGWPLTIDFIPVDDIPRLHGGKFEDCISLVP